MVVGLITWELHLDGCRSLKEKRHVLKSLKDRLHNRFNVSVAEVEHHDLWQRATIAVSAVAGETFQARKVMHEVERFVERHPGVETIDAQLTLHSPDD